MPRLVREGFSLGAFLFGPFWLLAHRAWIAGLIALVVLAALWAFVLHWPGATLPGVLLAAYALLMGLTGRDLCRWSLARRGFSETYVVAARNAEAAFARLLDRDPTLAAEDLV
ncbi:DUF2628 domain-containing protein [Acidisoma sp. 7E03]